VDGNVGVDTKVSYYVALRPVVSITCCLVAVGNCRESMHYNTEDS
jgi:hypothetical protein